jgi:hypothetical protein
MAQKWQYVVKDNSKGKSGSAMYVSDLAASGDSIIYTGVDNLTSILADLTTANIVGSSVTVKRPTGLDIPSPDVNSQNEIYLSVSYLDNVTNKKYRFSIPSPDPALRQANTDNVDEANARWTAAVAVWEAAGVSELDNAITILGGKFEGRAQ